MLLTYFQGCMVNTSPSYLRPTPASIPHDLFVFSENPGTSKDCIMVYILEKLFLSLFFVSGIVERLQRIFWNLDSKYMKIYILGDCHFSMFYT